MNLMDILAIVFLVTCFFSFGVQCMVYCFMRMRRSTFLHSYAHVFNYLSGVIGDFVLIPLVNVFAFLSFGQTPLALHVPSFGTLWGTFGIFALCLGFITTYLFHIAQEKLLQINWTMPQIGQWTTLGLYHAIFMFFETSFLWYAVLHYVAYGRTTSLAANFIFAGVALLVIFFITFLIDYRNPATHVFHKARGLARRKKQ